MRFYLNSVLIIVVSVLTSLIIYPVLHEAGHLAGALIMRYKITDIGIGSTLYITCMADDSVGKTVFVAFSGVIVPVCVSILIPGKRFYMWLAKTVIIATDIIVVFLSVLSVVLYLSGVVVKNNDLISVVSLHPVSIYWCIIVSVFIEALFICILKYLKPFDRIYDFLKNK